SGCAAMFSGPSASTPAETSTAALLSLIQMKLAEKTGGTAAEEGFGVGQADSAEGEAGIAESSESEAGIAESSKTTEGTEPLLEYLRGP
ncbi:MAG TPA: hypothetical protein VGV69_07790, partial [Solirubrobacterales bacterium]|nr:hypothetical protein [Solirubrobacterales bacterium]